MRVTNKVHENGLLVVKCPICYNNIEFNSASYEGFPQCDCDKNYVIEGNDHIQYLRKVTPPRFIGQDYLELDLNEHNIKIEDDCDDSILIKKEIEKANKYLHQLSAREKNDYVVYNDEVHKIKDFIDGKFVLDDDKEYDMVFSILITPKILKACGFVEKKNGKEYILHHEFECCKYIFDGFDTISMEHLTPYKIYDTRNPRVNVLVISQLQKILRDRWGDKYELSTDCSKLNEAIKTS